MMTPEVLAMFNRVLGTMEALGRVDDAILARCAALTEDNARLWDANAELRDDLHTLADRFERHQAKHLLAVVTDEPA